MSKELDRFIVTHGMYPDADAEELDQFLCAHGSEYATVRMLGVVLKPFLDEFRNCNARLAAVEKRLDFVESKGIDYRGVWNEQCADYMRGDAVTFRGSLWICKGLPVSGMPGNSDNWQLAVTRGRDAGGRQK
jgi:hypothetical protein